MWLNLVQQPIIIQSIYKDDEISLDNIEIIRIEIDCLNGWDFRLWFDLEQLPTQLPLKWQKNDYNTVQVSFRLLENEIIIFKNSNLSNIKGKLEITEAGNFKKVIFKTIDLNIIFELKCKWIYVNHISAYSKGN